MNDYLKTLELSVRTISTLKLLGVDSESALLAITSAQFLGTKGAGLKSWNELQELRHKIFKEKKSSSAEGRALALVRQLNLHMRSIKQQGYYLATNSETREVVLCKQINERSE